MSRAAALVKLLSLGPLSRPELRQIMGGDPATVDAALADLRQAGAVTYRNADQVQRWYLTSAASVGADVPRRCAGVSA